MPFENFYKEANQYAHRLRLCLLAAGLFIAAYFGLPVFVSWLLTASEPPSERAVNQPALADADALCRSVPKPERLSMSGLKETKTDDGSAQIVHSYQSERAADEIMPQFLIWFAAEGWQRVYNEVYASRGVPDRVINFRRENRRVSVLYFDLSKNDFNPPGQAQFEIICTVEKSQPRN